MGNISNISLNLLLEEVYLKGKLNSLNENIINKGFDVKTNPVLKEIISQLKSNFNFIMTYGVGISAFIGPVKSLLENKNLNVTDYDVTLLTIVAIYIILSKPKEEIDEVVDKIKERGLEKEISPVLNFISKTINLFKIFGKKFGYMINNLLDILSFTFLSVPVLDFIKNLATEKGFTINNVQELLSGIIMAVGTHGLKNLFNKNKIQENKENKFQNPKDYIGSIFYYTNKPNEEYKIEDLHVGDGYDDFIISWEDPVNGIKHKIGYYVIDFLKNLESGRIKLKKIGAYQKEVENIINNLFESDDFGWVEEIKEFSPAEEFLYEMMSNLKMTPSKNYPGWMLYKDESERILMADDIDLNDNFRSLLISYDGIFQILRNKFKLEYGEIAKPCKKIFNLVHKRQVDAVGALYNLHLSQF